MGGIFDVDLENGLVEEPEGKRLRFEKERKKGSKDGLQWGGEGNWEERTLSAHASLSAAKDKADSEEGNRGVNFKFKI